MNDIAQICKLNNMSESEFLNQISLNFLTLMDMQLEKSNNEPLAITQGNVSLLIFRPKETNNETS
jgi:hypothetical protein